MSWGTETQPKFSSAAPDIYRQLAMSLQLDHPLDTNCHTEKYYTYPLPREVEFEAGMTGGDVIHAILAKLGVNKVFGYSGGAALPIFDAIYKSPTVEIIRPRHEQGGGHMAEAYARSTGRTGVCLVTSGPGATNMVTSMKNAAMDGTPLVVLCGQVSSTCLGTDAFQETNMIDISRTCTKWNTQVLHANELPGAMMRAFQIARSGRHGPVLIDIPKDVSSAKLVGDISLDITQLCNDTIAPDTEQGHDIIEKVADVINKSEKPVIIAGYGIIAADAAQELRKLSEKANIPVTTTLHGLGAFDEMSSRSLKMVGMHGSASANLAVQNSDCVIALGVRFDDRVTCNASKFAPEALRAGRRGLGGIIHFEIAPDHIDRLVLANYAVLGDVKCNLQKLIPHIRHKPRLDWCLVINGWKIECPFSYEPATDGCALKPQQVITELNQQLHSRDNDFIITTGVGQHQMWAAQYITWRTPRSMITSGGFGTMGFGMPAAIGAKIANPNKIVVDIDGDASYIMTCQELLTAVEYRIPIKVLILNNSYQGMVRQLQDFYYEGRHSHCQSHNPDFVNIAKSMGAEGFRVSQVTDLSASIQKFLDCNVPVVLDAVVEQKENVFPMVMAGRALDEMIFS